MKSLAIFCSFWLLVLAARAEIATGTPTLPPPSAPSGVNWSAAIEKSSREGSESAADGVDANLLEHHLLELERPLTRPPARAASAPAPGASRPAGAVNAAIAAATLPERPEKSDDEDWTRALRHTVWDIVKPYQDFIPGAGSSGRPPSEDPLDVNPRMVQGSTGPRYAPRSEHQRQVEQIRSDYLISQFIDEVKPWAIGIVGVGILALAFSQWLAYVKRKHGVKSGRHRSSRKRRRKLSRRLDT